MTNVELACFVLGWSLLLHALYQISPIAMEMALALQFLIMANPSPKAAKQ